jgi:hypothetical protein
MRGRHGTLPTRLCQHHFHLSPRLLVDARSILGHAWRHGWFVQAFPQSRDRWGFFGKIPFISNIYFLHRRCKTLESIMSPVLICSNPATEGPSDGIPRRLLIVHGGHCRWKHATEGVPHRAPDTVPEACCILRPSRAASSSAPRACEASEVACALRYDLAL